MPSSVIRNYKCDAETEELEVLFTTGRRYVYHAVPQAAVDEFRAAFSKGRHFNAHIRDAYDYSELISSRA
jgi:KTSC domain-containing protein